ncbi:glycosyltransferase family 2 protein [[Hallella] seregens]|uniref:Glycosyltransferase family 2 protein n=1 Tax=Hallella seregens ATCC 51272 TaxID=1336250 RepID=A0ABV5ZHM9_9BACT|nr:glycosyltransferase family 2 protein [Hallella seregens]
MDQGAGMKLSVITINYNNRDGLRKTLESVVAQTYGDFEYIIIDGGSTDGSVEVIKEHEDKVSYWVSEEDNGIYHAMNKGVKAAHGEYCMFLNSGDSFYSQEVLQHVFSQNVHADIACGDLTTGDDRVIPAPEEVTMAFMMRGSLSHPAAFTRRTLLVAHPFNEQSKIIADHEFFMYALVKMNASYQKLRGIVSVFDLTGVSCTTRSYGDEELKILQNTEGQILLPRVKEDYDIFMGKRDDYHRLFYLLGFSKHRKWIYTLVVVVLKMIMLNRGFVKDFSIKEKRE